MRWRRHFNCILFLLLAIPVCSAGAQDIFSQYVGQYRSAADASQVTAVYLDGGNLYEESAQRQRQRLISDPAVPDQFTIASPRAHVLFLRDAANTITGLRVTLDSDGRILLSATRFSRVGTRLNHARAYIRSEVMIPMRDGVRLHAVILRPEGDAPSGGWPFLMARTPYGVEEFDSQRINDDKPELAASGYIFVYEDIRGRYGSEGKFVMNRPVVPHNTRNDIDETTDAYDTVDWLVKNVPGNNGRVGVFGVSYDGFLAMMAGIDAHPAVKAISPQAPMTDVWMGDDFFHNGAFRESYGFDYVQSMERQKTDVTVNMKQDMFDFFLQHGNFASAAAAAKMEKLPTAEAFLTQPEYTKFWRDMAVEYHLNKVEVPTLEVGGYWDQEDMWGTQAEYAALKPHDTQHEVFMVLGPWNHGGWHAPARVLGSSLGRLEFGEPTGTEFRTRMEAPFFEKYLKDKPGFDIADTESYRTGVNRWEKYDAWPPKSGFAPARLYLEPGKQLSFAAPATSSAQGPSSPRSSKNSGKGIAASYVANPADPVPYRHRPISSTYAPGSLWYTWLAEDQRFVTGRKDIATFTMAPLDHDVTITGDVTADLFAATTGSDADWIVKLIDVYPDDAPPQRTSPPGTSDAATNPGYELMVADEIFRGRYLHSFEQPEALKPGAINEFKYSLHGVDHTFLKGHSIMVEVQSSWFPLYDRNPQTFVPNIMTAPKKAYKAEKVTIYGSPQFPSHLEFEVVK